MQAPKRPDLALAAGIALISMALYALTAAPGLTWAHNGADGGDLIAAAMSWGVPHPSGYPTYCLLSRLWALLPLGSIARRYNLFSGFCAAMSAGLLYDLLRRILASQGRDARAPHLLAAVVALTWASGRTLWSQALITEVYSLGILFVVLTMWLASRIDSQSPRRDWMLVGVAGGLGIGAHLTNLWILPTLAILLWPYRDQRRIVAAVLGGIAGLAVFAYIPLAAAGDPPVSWGDARTWQGFWWLLSGRLYRGYLFSLPLTALPSRLGAWMQDWAAQFSPVGLALALLGLWNMLRRSERRWAWGTLALAFCSIVYALGYDTSDSYVYLLPSYAATAIWLAHGTAYVLDQVQKATPPARQQTVRWTVLAFAVCLPLVNTVRLYPQLDLSRDTEATVWLADVNSRLPADALVISGRDDHTFSLAYAQSVEGSRPDLIVVDGELWAHDWYRQQLARLNPTFWQSQGAPHPPDETPPVDLVDLIRVTVVHRPVYLLSERPELAGAFATTPSQGLIAVNDPRDDGG